MRGVLFFMCCCFASAYHFVIVPGLGGSILYNQKSQKIWPPEIGFSPSDLSIQEYYHKHDLSTLGEIGNIDSIRIDSRTTFMLTKNTYYSKMIDYLSRNNNQISALPYDFRMIHYQEYSNILFAAYKNYIQTNFHHNNNEKCILVAHSMGGIIINQFLRTYVDKRWIQKYIEKVYYINVPFGGCPSALFFLLESMDRHLNKQNKDQLLFNNHILWMMSNIQNIHLFGGIYLCLPITKDPLARLNRRWIYNRDVPHLFTDDTCAHTYRLSRSFFRHQTQSIDVPQTVIYSSGKNTTVFMDFDSEFSMMGDGDGLVPIESLLYPQTWKKQPSFVHVRNQDHSGINSHLPVLEMIRENRDTLDKPKKKSKWWIFR